MDIALSKAQDAQFDTVIIAVPDDISETAFKAATKLNAPLPKPEKGGWHYIAEGAGLKIVFVYSAGGHLTEVAKQFRLLAHKTSKDWSGNAALDATHLGDHLFAAMLGLELSDYDLGMMKTGRPAEKAAISLSVIGSADQDQLTEARIRARAQKRAMHLVDLPPNEKTPEFLGDWAKNAAEKYQYECTVLDAHHIQTEGLHALHAVGKGSDNPPVFIVSKYTGKPDDSSCHLALVGKGVTFDTGGLSIKPSDNMHYMKSDMAGAAAMLGAIEVAAQLKLPINMVAIVPSAENAVDARSVRPADIIHSYAGKTIEIINTDAEGRLALADGLAWAVKNLKPNVLIDMATLTGSSVRTLGKEASALYSENDALLEALQQSGQKTGEKLWPMPLWADYDGYITSDVADLTNLPLTPVAGSIAAAKFLQVFADGHPCWAHIDMPGMSFGDSPFFKTKSATGFGVQLLTELMKQLAANPKVLNN